ncbi:FAD-dependent oxidoreductase [Pseudonocardia phyllosphaerae]|uniref:FAD-dependent oxidoreductase n=1 Tax=Pseudonocardia phyllosphaerae TaxID=3390502 RepID=UPI00397B8C09
MSARAPRVIIAGAGTGGLCLAHGLRRAGIEVVVLERDRHRTGGLQGYRVGISPNGARALRACLPPQLYALFEASTGDAYDGMLMCTERYRELLALPYAELPGGGDDEHNVSRATLHQVLLRGLTDVVHFGRTVTGYAENQDGTVTVHADGGADVTGDLLVGADGANSRVRPRLLPGAGHTSTGLVGIGGRAPLDMRTLELLPGGPSSGITLLFDRHGGVGITHVMRMRWDDEHVPRTGIEPRHAAALASPLGRELLAADTTTDFVSWGLTVPAHWFPDGPPSRDDTPGVFADVGRLTSGWDPRWQELVHRSAPESAVVIDIRTSDPLPDWTPGPVTLLGDAAHTMTPGRGAGANTALRDARELRDRLVRVRDGELDLRTAVGEYEALMRRYSAVAVRESLEFLNDDVARRSPAAQAVATTVQRTGMRLVNHVPALRRRIARGMQRVRDSEFV